MRAPHRLVLSGLAAGALGLALAGLGDAELRLGERAATERESARALQAPARRAGGLATAAKREDVAARAGLLRRGGGGDERARRERTLAEADEVVGRQGGLDAPGGAGPGPRVRLDPLEPTPGRVSAALHGDDPGAPRRLVLWRVTDERAARAGQGASRADGSLDFPEVLLVGRGELFVTGAGIGAELAARLPSDRIEIPAPQPAAADDEATRGSPEPQEATR